MFVGSPKSSQDAQGADAPFSDAIHNVDAVAPTLAEPADPANVIVSELQEALVESLTQSEDVSVAQDNTDAAQAFAGPSGEVQTTPKQSQSDSALTSPVADTSAEGDTEIVTTISFGEEAGDGTELLVSSLALGGGGGERRYGAQQIITARTPTKATAVRRAKGEGEQTTRPQQSEHSVDRTTNTPS